MAEGRGGIQADLDSLSRVAHRHAGSEGEREMVQAIRARLPDDARGRVEGFVAHTRPEFWTGLHAALLLAAGAFGYLRPGVGAVLCALITLSLVGEGLARFKLLRWFAPTSPSYNLVVERRVERPLGAVVIAAPLDSPMFRSILARGGAFRPGQVLFWAAVAVTAMLSLRFLAEPWGRPSTGLYLVSLVILAASALASMFALRPAEANEAPAGAATLMELERRFDLRPVDRVEVWVVWTGCARAFQGGIGAFLDLHGRHLPEPTLVIALEDTGRAPLRATLSEGGLFRQPHRPTGPALVERLRWAGVRVELVDHAGATDAREAMVRGYRALALVGGDGPVEVDEIGRAADVAETIVRWYADDLAGVAEQAPTLEGLAAATRASEAAEQDRHRSRRGLRRGTPKA